MAQQHIESTVSVSRGAPLGYVTREDANRKIALEVLNRRRPASSAAARVAPPTTHPLAMRVPAGQRSRSGSHSGWSYSALRGSSHYESHSGSERERYLAPRRAVDGYLRPGSNTIEWKQHPVRYPLGTASAGLPWWHENGHYRGATGLGRPAPAQHLAERALAGRYHQLLTAGRARGSMSPYHDVGGAYVGHGYATGHPHGGAYHPPCSPTHVHHHYYHYGERAPSPQHAPRRELPHEARYPTRVDDLEYAPYSPREPYSPRDDDEEDYGYEERWEKYEVGEEEAEEEQREDPPPPAPTPAPTPKPAPPATKHPPVLDAGCPTPLAKFRAALAGAGHPTDPAHKAKRDELWPHFDANGNGYISLAEANSGVMRALCNMWHREGNKLFKRYYRSYIRAFNDAKDAVAARAGRPLDDDYVTYNEFRYLLVYLGIYATWYEVFMAIDGGTEGLTVEDDHRLSHQEWIDALPRIRQAGSTWADSIALANATEADFDAMDRNRGGYVDLQEFCEWVEHAEKKAGTPQGVDLGVNESLDIEQASGRKWHTEPLEMRAGRGRPPM